MIKRDPRLFRADSHKVLSIQEYLERKFLNEFKEFVKSVDSQIEMAYTQGLEEETQ